MLLMICKSSALRLVMTSHRGEGAEAWLRLVQRCEARTTHQRAARAVNADLSGDLEDKTLLWERLSKTHWE